MDDLTAIAFAQEAFERLHPDAPEWLRDYSCPTIRIDGNRDHYLVEFVWHPRSSQHGAEPFFQVEVNAWNAKTRVLLDTPLDKYDRSELDAYRSGT